jgi:hypothetical protein
MDVRKTSAVFFINNWHSKISQCAHVQFLVIMHTLFLFEFNLIPALESSINTRITNANYIFPSMGWINERKRHAWLKQPKVIYVIAKMKYHRHGFEKNSCASCEQIFLSIIKNSFACSRHEKIKPKKLCSHVIMDFLFPQHLLCTL